MEYTRKVLYVEMRTRMNAHDVLEAPHLLLIKHGNPEFISKHLQDWLNRIGVKPIQIYPSSPWENGYNQLLNGTLRKEVLNAEWFHSTR